MSNEDLFIVTSSNPRFEAIYAKAIRQGAARERHIRAARGIAAPSFDRPRTNETSTIAFARIAEVMSDEPKTTAEVAAAVGMHPETARKYLSRHVANGTIRRGLNRCDGTRELQTFVRGDLK